MEVTILRQIGGNPHKTVGDEWRQRSTPTGVDLCQRERFVHVFLFFPFADRVELTIEKKKCN